MLKCSDARFAGRPRRLAPALNALLATLGAIGLLLGPAPCLAQAGPTGPALVIATSRTSLALPLYVAEAQGYFRQAGVTVRSPECLGGQRCVVEMLEGRADVATASELPVMFKSFERDDLAIFVTFVSSVKDVKVVVRKSSGIDSLAGLVGKRVATTKATSAHYYLDSALLFEGVDPKRLEIVSLPPEQAGPALLERRADAAVVWEPFAHETLRALGADAHVLPGVRIYASTFNLVARREVLARREADLIKALRAIDRAIGFIRDEPLQAQAILKTRLGMDQAFIDATWRDYQFRLVLNQSLVSTMEGQARWALREGHVPAGSRVANLLRFFEPAPLAQAVPGAVTLVK